MEPDIDWLLLAAGNATGAFVAARRAIERRVGFVRSVLIVILLLSAIALPGDYRIGGA